MIKGQASLEYLMTYGIAIAIVVVAIAALYSMGVFKPSSSSVPCSPCFANFAFKDYGGGTLIIKNGPRELDVFSVSCEGTSCTASPSEPIDPSADITITGITTTGDVQINITYSYVGSEINHTDTATIHN
ncbi:MAG: hypothetical protein B6U88_02030 [Candidatus Aenigmarchaeota archaeon ex4484_56]|nr:MAG: hypothetical protein B6U88_02030 [Candidatus Aenigmarchaeota archaeon ex4484_56]